ncbi:MAG: hypothetical protein ACREGH_00465 [Minisyncoccia bacterium]
MDAKQDAMIKLFGSAERLRLLRLFFFNPRHLFTSEEVAERAKMTPRAAGAEMRSLTEAGILRALETSKQPKLRYIVDEKFRFFDSLREMLLDAPMRSMDIYKRVRGLGTIKFIGIGGIFVGDFDGHIDVLVVGERIDERRFKSVMRELEHDIGRELRFAWLPTPDFLYRLTVSDRFIRDFVDFPHRILFDRLGAGVK